MFYIRKPVQKCQHFIYVCKTNVKCVQNSYQSFSDNDIDYKPSMKNVQSFHVIRFFIKMTFVPRWRFEHFLQ